MVTHTGSPPRSIIYRLHLRQVAADDGVRVAVRSVVHPLALLVLDDLLLVLQHRFGDARARVAKMVVPGLRV